MKLKKYFKSPQSNSQRYYEALRMHLLENIPLEKVAQKLSLSHSYLSKMKYNAEKLLMQGCDPFFIDKKTGPKHRHKAIHVEDDIIELRQKNHSIIDIKAILEAKGYKISLDTINNVLKDAGFTRLPRRSSSSKYSLEVPKSIDSPKSIELEICNEKFSTGHSGGVLVFLPLLEKLGIYSAIEKAGFPKTESFSAVSFVLAFLVLKLKGNKRLSHDESWAFDRVLGFFAGLNVLPKAASMASYSYRITRESNRIFLSELNRIFSNSIDDCEFNIDFKTIPHWGDVSVLEKNYSTTRGKSVKSILALIVQNVSNNRIAYTNADMHKGNEKDAVIEFVDFWKESVGTSPKMLIFDSQTTIYENLSKLNKDGIKFLTIRQRKEKMIAHANSIPDKKWQVIEVESSKRSNRKVQVYEEMIKLRSYDGEIRQLIIIDHSKQPVFMLTNDLESPANILVRKYGRRWLIEQEIAEQIAFFHLNQLSSSIVVKVDFDLTMTVLAHNLYRVLGEHIHKYENATVDTLYRCFIEGRAFVKVTDKEIRVTLSKRSHSPLLFEVPWIEKPTMLPQFQRKIYFEIGSTS
jgi:hypothetical protein